MRKRPFFLPSGGCGTGCSSPALGRADDGSSRVAPLVVRSPPVLVVGLHGGRSAAASVLLSVGMLLVLLELLRVLCRMLLLPLERVVGRSVPAGRRALVRNPGALVSPVRAPAPVDAALLLVMALLVRRLVLLLLVGAGPAASRGQHGFAELCEGRKGARKRRCWGHVIQQRLAAPTGAQRVQN